MINKITKNDKILVTRTIWISNICKRLSLGTKIIPKIRSQNVQLFHYSNDGSCTRNELVNYIKKIINGKSKIISVKSFDDTVKRPKNSV